MRIVSSCHKPPLPPLLQQRSMAAPTAKQNKNVSMMRNDGDDDACVPVAAAAVCMAWHVTSRH
jgi:hypothetical protein